MQALSVHYLLSQKWPIYANDLQIDLAWSKRTEKYGASIPGPIAASDAATALGVDKLSTSEYKTLQGLLKGSEYLSEKWERKGNTIIRR